MRPGKRNYSVSLAVCRIRFNNFTASELSGANSSRFCFVWAESLRQRRFVKSISAHFAASASPLRDPVSRINRIAFAVFCSGYLSRTFNRPPISFLSSQRDRFSSGYFFTPRAGLSERHTRFVAFHSIARLNIFDSRARQRFAR